MFIVITRLTLSVGVVSIALRNDGGAGGARGREAEGRVGSLGDCGRAEWTVRTLARRVNRRGQQSLSSNREG